MKQLRLLFLSLTLVFALPAMASGFGGPSSDGVETLRIEASVFPNPTNGVFFLNIDSQFSESFEVKIVNLIGQPVNVREVYTNERTQFDLSGLPKGVYFVKIKVDQQQVVKRIILQ
ncbi:MAG: T9SS type A sorting domain-containing protein [Bacteroidia bacterium]|nr:T9SS type A sorting domain-containing protein [Bacteroidia bacterium]